MTDAEKKRQNDMDRLRRELGPVVMAGLEDKRVVEVMVNPDGNIYLDKVGEGMVLAGKLDANSAFRAVLSIGKLMEKEVTPDSPQLECELPLDGSRFAGSIPPTARQAFFAIRKRAMLVFSLEDYVRDGILSPQYCDVLAQAIEARKNILVVGGTGSGKTTFANAILKRVAEVAGAKQRILIIEDTPELQCSAENKVELVTSGTVTMNDLLRHAMRLRPDRIVVGETRGKECLALLKAWNTGHPGGVSTVHANSAEAGLIRMEQLIQEAGVPPQPTLIGEAVNLVAFIERTSTGRKVSQLARVHGYDAGEQRYLVEAA
ncbi:P-type conjugative transfer ATPase TrbB [Ramlibacter alkalitolerans]|uniref:P-type conjugative transfer ATPase TrbB n=2 Tax=Ramlibacter alkalitolerans TaxID=2039631 RepID=A0ABS1JU24_9BURK|nr:P-type conjugative transfer ATPase TrbB [Ramlibacter alkalitolerans]